MAKHHKRHSYREGHENVLEREFKTLHLYDLVIKHEGERNGGKGACHNESHVKTVADVREEYAYSAKEQLESDVHDSDDAKPINESTVFKCVTQGGYKAYSLGLHRLSLCVYNTVLCGGLLDKEQRNKHGQRHGKEYERDVSYIYAKAHEQRNESKVKAEIYDVADRLYR